ncbi:rap1 GTPase-GDP dissociation stimulator 1-like [Gracilinanus agilis]|uniref:rap1 GTPase-GDP dissociation stimulator 1-like n=1 Tax=Gracilinanus agilis TaxID=191870 RepID=UPI001CFC7A28|nr:rap1 GTPase-GDP dissociation stimulator 1-like [Gracilinanus agilis]
MLGFLQAASQSVSLADSSWIGCPKVDECKAEGGMSVVPPDSLSQHLEGLKLFGNKDQVEAEEEIFKSLNMVLQAVTGDQQLSGKLLQASGIFTTLGQILTSHPRCAVPVTQVLAELAKNEELKQPCIDAGLITTLLPLLKSSDQDLLLHAGRAIGRICYGNNALKLQLVEADVQSALVELLQKAQDNPELEAIGILKTISDLVISLLLGDESMQKLFANGTGLIYQKISNWLMSQNAQLQLTGALAVANFARNDNNCVKMVQLGIVHQLLDVLEKHVEEGDVTVQHAALSALRNLAIPVINKVQMLEEGVAERIQMLLRSEMPPVQFKLLGTLRMLLDGQVEAAEILGQDPALLNRLVQWCEAKEHAGVQGEANRLLASLLRHSKSQEVVRAIQEARGMKHLVSMTTSEHAIMQNEALIALAIASAVNLEIIKDAFKESQLVSNLQKLLEDEMTSPEVKYKSLGLLCSLLGSGDLRKQVEEAKIQDTLENLCNHSNANVVKQAIAALQILKSDTQDSGLFFP